MKLMKLKNNVMHCSFLPKSLVKMFNVEVLV